MLRAVLAECSLNVEVATTSSGCGESLYHVLCGVRNINISLFLNTMQSPSAE